MSRSDETRFRRPEMKETSSRTDVDNYVMLRGDTVTSCHHTDQRSGITRVTSYSDVDKSVVISRVTTQAVGTRVRVFLSTEQLTKKQRNHLVSGRMCRQAKRLKFPCQVDIGIALEEHTRQHRSEVMLYVDNYAMAKKTEFHILRHLESFSVELGQPIRMLVEYKADTSPKVTWSRNGSMITDKRFTFETTNQKAQLCCERSTIEDTGEYGVTITYDGTRSTSQAHVTVLYERPSFSVSLTDDHVTLGRSARMCCTARGLPRPEVVWLVASRAVDIKSSKYHVTTSDDGRTCLVVNDFTFDDASKLYTCRASNLAGSVETSARLHVRYEAPEFMELFHDKVVTKGQRLTLVARVRGVPPPTIKWTRDSDVIQPSVSCLITQRGDECSLDVTDVTSLMNGLYSCVAQNEAGSAKCVARITINEPKPPPAKEPQVEPVKPVYLEPKPPPAKEPQVEPVKPVYLEPKPPPAKEPQVEPTKPVYQEPKSPPIMKEEVPVDTTPIVTSPEVLMEEKFPYVAAEFTCVRGTQDPDDDTMEVQSLHDPRTRVSERVESATQRRWIVKKANLNKLCTVQVDRWTVRSFVDYTCTAESLADIACGILDGVTYASQTVEFMVLMTQSCKAEWLKDGQPVNPQHGKRFNLQVTSRDTLFKLTITDVQDADQGVYTFRVLQRLDYCNDDSDLQNNNADKVPSKSSSSPRSQPVESPFTTNRLMRSPSREFVLNQLHAFDVELDEEHRIEAPHRQRRLSVDDDVFGPTAALDGDECSSDLRHTRRRPIDKPISRSLDGHEWAKQLARSGGDDVSRYSTRDDARPSRTDREFPDNYTSAVEKSRSSASLRYDGDEPGRPGGRSLLFSETSIALKSDRRTSLQGSSSSSRSSSLERSKSQILYFTYSETAADQVDVGPL